MDLLSGCILNSLSKKMKFEFVTEKKTLGNLMAGEMFYYNRKIWFVVNGVSGGGAKLIRPLGPGSQQSCIRPSKTKVTHLISATRKKT